MKQQTGFKAKAQREQKESCKIGMHPDKSDPNLARFFLFSLRLCAFALNPVCCLTHHLRFIDSFRINKHYKNNSQEYILRQSDPM